MPQSDVWRRILPGVTFLLLLLSTTTAPIDRLLQIWIQNSNIIHTLSVHLSQVGLDLFFSLLATVWIILYRYVFPFLLLFSSKSFRSSKTTLPIFMVKFKGAWVLTRMIWRGERSVLLRGAARGGEVAALFKDVLDVVGPFEAVVLQGRVEAVILHVGR